MTKNVQEELEELLAKRRLAYDLEQEVQNIKEEIKEPLEKALALAGLTKFTVDCVGTVTHKKSSTREGLNKDALKVELLKSTPAAAIAKAFKLATVLTEVAGSVSFTPYKGEGGGNG